MTEETDYGIQINNSKKLHFKIDEDKVVKIIKASELYKDALKEATKNGRRVTSESVTHTCNGYGADDGEYMVSIESVKDDEL